MQSTSTEVPTNRRIEVNFNHLIDHIVSYLLDIIDIDDNLLRSLVLFHSILAN